ncbi:MAG: hypothetical protein HYS13_04425 [Planctomycetia bacterium]|nr:hypothetical protein [Planctomycetia bacterium]
MDKKAKKRLDLAHHKLQQLRQQLAGAKAQRDEPEEITRLEKEIAELEAEVAKLKSS